MGRVTITPGHAWQCTLPDTGEGADPTTEAGGATTGEGAATGEGTADATAGENGEGENDEPPADPCASADAIKKL